jgi:hypothetical protein
MVDEEPPIGKWPTTMSPDVAYEAAGQRDAVGRAVARDKPVATSMIFHP